MPYVVQGKCLHKKNPDGSVGETVKCHESEEKAKAHMRALYANVKDSDVVEMSLAIVKASYDKSEPDPNKKRRILMTNSDVAPDLYDERMSIELFQDFTKHIENKDPVPEIFKPVVCEDVWCGGMPYLSIAHYTAGKDGKNIPGMPESVYVDGNQLKSKAYIYDNSIGRALFDSLCADETKKKSGVTDFEPVRVSIGFLDLEHVHEINGKSVVFTRKALGQKCALCEKGEGGKIYKKGYLVHLAATRKPVNPRTEMGLEQKSMDEIITKKDDAASIVGSDLANELETKSLVDDVLVVKGVDGVGTLPADIPPQIDDNIPNAPYTAPIAKCYDPNTDSFAQSCIDDVMSKFMADIRNEMNTVKSFVDGVQKSLEQLQAKPVVEESMDKEHEMKESHEEEKEEEAKKEESVAARSTLDKRFETLKSLLASSPTAEEVQKAFNELGTEVEKAYTPPAPTASDIEAIVKSAVESAVKPLAIELAQIKASQQVTRSQVVDNPISRALSLKPQELLQKSVAQAPTRKLSQIEKIAKSSVYGSPVE